MSTSDTVILLEDCIPHRGVILITALLIITLYNSFVLYVIGKETPRFMKEYKPFLAQTVAAFIFWEWTVFFFFLPYIIHGEDGSLVVISASIISICGINIHLPLLVFLFGQGVFITLHSNFRSFYFRMMAIQPKSRQKLLTTLFYSVFTFSFCISEICATLISTYYLESSGQQYGLLSNTGSHVIQTAFSINFEKVRRTFVIIAIVFCSGIGGPVTMIVYTYHCLYSQQNIMSLRTKMVHRKLFWGLFTQWWTTIGVGTIPVFMVGAMAYFPWKLADLFNISCPLCFCLCGLSLPSVVLMSIRPYRQFTVKLLQNMRILRKSALKSQRHIVTTVDPSVARTGSLWLITTVNKP